MWRELLNLFGKKGIIAIIFLFLISIVTGYSLLEINRHEKALLGQTWLNPVPPNEWKDYITQKENFEKKLAFYKNNNPKIIELVNEYNSKFKPTYLELINANVNKSLELSKQGQLSFSV